MDLQVTRELTIPATELVWRFSRSSGPGGQHVNTSDSRVELLWDAARSRALAAALSPERRDRALRRLAPHLIAGVLTVTASEQRSQLRNRERAQHKLAERVAAALAPDPAPRRATRPTRGSQRRHLAAKTQRSATKQLRRRPSAE
ncbi:alternative ribosome rescue aminoacyl-tRNA hydrolase ArfB [Leucobacter chromiireducens]|uniref:Aminoacyl-tRNA hydrolase n=1 Tax=Leucobacter chromiireducens subsp. solipictus TaxID=398235 RepID=A0ABS1SI15_9MICO|nr:alternative ribosome rescue aminoacyl-tRNA hydrolase ArfB [Leucobacter chromiireducens]MBL3679124.1 aminoacyl-tRNA hydrolase [Leucobacter chromiireducens subsp. solipictus]